MRARHHVIVSAGVSLGFQAVAHSWPAALGCFLSGVLIDTDHFLDYVIYYKKFPFRYKDLADFSFEAKATKTYLIFHSYEALAALWLSIFLCDLGKIWTGVALGLTTHVLFDQIYNPIKPWFYFFTFRMANYFEKSKILSEAYFQKCKRYEKMSVLR